MSKDSFILPLMTPQQAVAEAERCLGCSDAPCIRGCPARNNIVKFVHQIAQQNFRGAIRTVRESNVLAGTCAYICPVSETCELGCGVKLERPVKIGELQRFVAEYERENGFKKFKTFPKNGKRVGLIGAGPAGLAAAFYLECLGFEADLYEASEIAGGILSYGIPDHRLIPDIVSDEIDFITSSGVNLFVNSPVLDLEEFVSKYDAVFIGVGANMPVKLNVPGEKLDGVDQAIDYLSNRAIVRRLEKTSSPKLGKRVVVFGGGNTAIDAAISAKLSGCEEVAIYYRRSEKEMTAFRDEIEHCRLVGVEINTYRQPVGFEGQNNKLTHVVLIRSELGEIDESGRPRPVLIEGSEHRIEVDTALIAVGQKATFTGSELVETDDRGLIIIDPETRITSHPKIFAGGDAVNGGATVVQAVADGRKAAEGIYKQFT